MIIVAGKSMSNYFSHVMKRIFLIITFFCASVIVIAQNNLEFKIKRQTPEPNTKLSFMSKAVLKRVNKAILNGNVDSIFNYYNNKYSWLITKEKYFVETHIGKNNIKTRIYYPTKRAKRMRNKIEPLPVSIFYHGGGFIWGDLDMFDMLAVKFAKKLNSIIVVPDYRLAPKYPYPAAPDDCEVTLDWVYDNIGKYGGNPNKIGIMGESAGGNLTLVTAFRNLKKLHPKAIDYMVLYVPSTSMADTGFQSRNYFFDSCGVWYVLNRPLMTKIRDEYLQNTPTTILEASPLNANYDKSFPPTLVVTAKCDPLRDEGNALALKMKQSGVDVTNVCYPKTIHGFVCMYPVLRQGRQAIRQTKRFVRNLK